MAILALPNGMNPDSGTMKFTIYLQDFVDISIMHLVLLKASPPPLPTFLCSNDFSKFTHKKLN